MNDGDERKQALKRQSDDYMRLARDKATLGLEREAAAAAYEAGYFALMTALTAAEVRLFQDHPSAVAAELAAARLGTTAAVQRLAIEGATALHAPESGALRGSGWVDWARHLRRIVGIDEY
jgi:hypothetical protein